MSWNIGDERNLFVKLKSKLGLYHIIATVPQTSPEILTLTVVEMQQLPDIDNTDFKEAISCRKRTIFSGRRKVCVNFHTDTDNLIIVVYRYRNSLYIKGNKVDLNLTEYQSLLSKRFYLLSYIDICYKRCIYWMRQLFIFKTKSVKNGHFFPHEHFPILPGIKNAV